MIRALDLADWAGRWVALDEHDCVARDAETLEALMATLADEGVDAPATFQAVIDTGGPIGWGSRGHVSFNSVRLRGVRGRGWRRG